MRDIALTGFILVMLPFVFKRPYIGVLLWAWVSFMVPHRLTFGFAHNFPFAAVIAATTLFALVFPTDRKPFPWGPIPALILVFVGWMSITSLFAMGSSSEVYDEWIRVIKIHLMLLVTIWLIHGRKHIELLVWIMVVSVGYYGVKGGVWTVLRGGGERVWGPPGGVIEGNNELALALVMMLPLMCYLWSVNSRKLVKWGLVFAMIACSFSILGSHSRGAFLAILAVAALLALKSQRPILLGIAGAVGLAMMIAFMPAHWIERMHTIETYDQESSALSRLTTWQTIWNMALDRPILGAGFETELVEIYVKYSPIATTTTAAPHSIYFQALGEHGFVGLGIFLVLLIVSWRTATRIIRTCRNEPDLRWAALLVRMLQVSLLGYMV